MADFIVLTDTDVQTLLRNARQSEVTKFADILTKTLHTYSTTDEATYQPLRSTIKRPTGQVSVFMPSTAPDYAGVKTVGLPASNTPPQKGQPAPALQASLVLCDAYGKATGILNAAELTAFRTSLGSMLLFRHRKNVKNIVIFGAGAQGYWHLRLAVILRGKDIQTITIVNRSAQRSNELIESFTKDTLSQEHPHIQFSTLSPSDTDYDTKVKSAVTNANAIHTTVPTTEPIFPAEWLYTDSSSLKKDVYISAIGSYRLDMRELDPELIRHIVSSSGTYVPKGRKNPVIVVDTRQGCFQEAGELVAAKIDEEDVIEIGELEGLIQENPEGLGEWLASGLVVYKSVGFGVMDICTGKAVVDLAREKGLGVCVPNF